MKYVRDEANNLYEALDAAETAAQITSAVNTEKARAMAAEAAEEAALAGKVDKVTGKGLSSNDFTDEHKEIVESMEAGTVTGVKGDNESDYRHGNVNITPDNIGLSKANLINMIYPVGSLYMNTNNVNPATIFGGTWERIKDKFILSSGDRYANGETGGEATHELTEAELPIHNHGLNAHTHSIPALGGTATGGKHTHRANTNTWTQTGGYGSVNPSGSGGSNQANITGSTGLIAESGSLTMSVTTNASTTGGNSGNTTNTGSGTAHNNMPPYLTVNVWKRTA